MRDFKTIMQTHNYWKDSRWNGTDSIYTFETGSQIEFFSADNGDKLRGARRDRLFLNECNNVTFEAFQQLEVRTKQFIYLDWNPSIEFWYYTNVRGVRDDVEELTVTYLDNEALDPNIKASIEQRKSQKAWWQVYGLGQLGEIDALVYKGWQLIDEIPHEAHLEAYGLDFGYTNDPTAIVALYSYNGGIIYDEIAFNKGLQNKQIADILLAQTKAITIADSAEPKSIDEIASYGVSILPCTKGPGSVLKRIDWLQSQKVSVTKRSINIIKAQRGYQWATDKDGRVINDVKPDHYLSDMMDACGYASEVLRNSAQKSVTREQQTQFAVKQSRQVMNSMR